MNTLKETKRRLRVAAALVRSGPDDGRFHPYVAKNCRVEVGTRLYPIHIVGHVPTRDEVWRNEKAGVDDLADFIGVSELRASDGLDDGYLSQIFESGYVAHLYFSDAIELIDVVTVWLGDDTHEPELV